MAKSIFDINCPLKEITLSKFSDDAYEGKQFLNSLAASNNISIEKFRLPANPEWWENEHCV